MQNFSKLGPWLIGITLGIMAALLIVPQSRVLVMEQGSVALGKRPNSDGPPTQGNVRVSDALKRHPDEVPLHLAAVLSQLTIQQVMDPHFSYAAARNHWLEVHALVERYPNSAVPAAVSLRTAMPDFISVRTSGDTSHITSTDPHDAALFDQDAAAGERIDPNNAYFPMMRAVGLYATGHEREAAAAVLRAGTKSAWNEYFADEIQGRWHLAEITDGGSLNVLQRAGISTEIMLQNYASLNGLSQRIAVLAARDEKTGATAQGIALRRAMTRCGGLMRAQSSTAIGSLVGIFIVGHSMAHPGGVPEPNLPNIVNEHQWRRFRLEPYHAFLVRNGEDAEARWAEQEFTADSQANEIISLSINSPRYLANVLLTRYLPLLLSGMLVLMNTLWVLLIGGMASFLCWVRARRTENDVRRASVPPSAFAVAVVLGLAGFTAGPLFADGAGQSGLFSDTLFMASLTALIVSMAALMLFAMHVRVSLGEGARVFLVGLGIVAVLVLALLFASQQTLSAEALLTAGGADINIGDETAGYKYGVLIFAAPAALFAIIAVVTVVRRIPFALGLARGFAACWPPVTMLLVMGYAGVIATTIRQDAEITKALTFQVTDEGQYLASLEGTRWPGVVPEAPASAAAKAAAAP